MATCQAGFRRIASSMARYIVAVCKAMTSMRRVRSPTASDNQSRCSFVSRSARLPARMASGIRRRSILAMMSWGCRKTTRTLAGRTTRTTHSRQNTACTDFIITRCGSLADAETKRWARGSPDSSRRCVFRPCGPILKDGGPSPFTLGCSAWVRRRKRDSFDRMRRSSPTFTAHTALEIQLRANNAVLLPVWAERHSDSNAVSFWSPSREGNLGRRDLNRRANRLVFSLSGSNTVTARCVAPRIEVIQVVPDRGAPKIRQPTWERGSSAVVVLDMNVRVH